MRTGSAATSGNGKFQDITAKAGIASDQWSSACTSTAETDRVLTVTGQ